MNQTNSAVTSVLPIIGYDRQARFVYNKYRPVSYGYPERQATVLTSEWTAAAALDGCLELAEHGAGLIYSDGRTPTKAEIRQFLAAKIPYPTEFHIFIRNL